MDTAVPKSVTTGVHFGVATLIGTLGLSAENVPTLFFTVIASLLIAVATVLTRDPVLHVHIFWAVVGRPIAPLWEVTCVFLLSTNCACRHDLAVLATKPKSTSSPPSQGAT